MGQSLGTETGQGSLLAILSCIGNIWESSFLLPSLLHTFILPLPSSFSPSLPSSFHPSILPSLLPSHLSLCLLSSFLPKSFSSFLSYFSYSSSFCPSLLLSFSPLPPLELSYSLEVCMWPYIKECSISSPCHSFKQRSTQPVVCVGQKVGARFQQTVTG